MIIASDLLYERAHATALAGVVARHARPSADVVLTDPGRGHSAGFGRLLRAQGFTATETRPALDGDGDWTPRGRLLRYRRIAVAS